MGVGSRNVWFDVRKLVSRPEFRLFCFPYAGGSASIYFNWHKWLPKNVEVCAIQLQGRGSRYNEELHTNMDQLVEDLVAQIKPLMDVPCAFFGHSMGGNIAFHLCHKLKLESEVAPKYLFLSGSSPPDVIEGYPGIDSLTDDEFWEAIKRLSGTPKELLHNAELMRLMLPVFKADYETLKSGREYLDSLEIPLVLIRGNRDNSISASEIKSWEKFSNARSTMHEFNGGHFYLHRLERELLSCLSSYIASSVE